MIYLLMVWLYWILFFLIKINLLIGDRDGKGTEARLQHPLDVKYIKQKENEFLLVADTYNNAIKVNYHN